MVSPHPRQVLPWCASFWDCEAAAASAFEAVMVGRDVLVGRHVLAAQNAWVDPSGDRVGVSCGASVVHVHVNVFPSDLHLPF